MLFPGLILGAVIVLAVWQPRGLSVAWPAAGGALLCISLGLVTASDVLTVVARTWNATMALVGLMLLSAVLDENGAFRAGAYRIARLSRGSGRRLFVGLCLLTFAATTLLANDGAVLLMTPIVAELTGALAFSEAAALACLFSTGFLCDALSTALPTSNLTNILMVDTLHISTGVFFLRMIVPSLAMLIVGVAALAIQFRRDLPRAFDVQALPDGRSFTTSSARSTLAALVLLVAGYSLAAFVRLPLGVVVIVVALLLVIVEQRTRAIDVRRLLPRLPLGIAIFAVALFVIVTAFAKAGASSYVAVALDPAARHGFVRLVVVTLAVTGLAAVGNNLPVFLVSLLVLEQAGHTRTLPFAALLGANVGSKLTPIGSLATLLWLGMLRQRGVRVGWLRYVGLAFVPTILVLIAGVLALSLL